MSENVISLRKGNLSWIAEYRGPHASRIVELFGTSILPVAYCTEARAELVLQAIRTLNPNVTIEVC